VRRWGGRRAGDTDRSNDAWARTVGDSGGSHPGRTRRGRLSTVEVTSLPLWHTIIETKTDWRSRPQGKAVIPRCGHPEDVADVATTRWGRVTPHQIGALHAAKWGVIAGQEDRLVSWQGTGHRQCAGARRGGGPTSS